MTASIRSFGNALRRPAATCSAVAIKRQKTTGLAPSAIGGLEDFDERLELWVGCSGQAFGPGHEGRERPFFGEAGRRFEIGCIHLVGIVVEDLLFEPLGICRKTIAKRAQSRSRGRSDAAHQRQCPPEGQPPPTLVRPGTFDDAEAPVERRVVKCTVLWAEIVSAFCCLVSREDALFAPVPPGDVNAPPLHKMSSKADPCSFALERSLGEFLIEQAQQAIECSLVAAVRRCRKEKQMTLWVFRQPLQQLEPLLTGLVRADAGMGLVDCDKSRTGPRKGVAAPVGLDVVKANHGIGVRVEQRLGRRQPAFEPGCGGGSNRGRVNVKLCFELAGPQLDQMRRAQDREAVGLTSVDQLAQDQPSLYRLADADIVSD